MDKFLFPVDFVVINMEEDDDASLIPGRPFMKTAKIMIDIDDGLMNAIMEVKRQVHVSTPFEKSLTNALKVLNEDEEKEIEECQRELEALEEIPPLEAKFENLKEEPKIEESKLELKMLHSHLKYAFLEEDGHTPVIISNALSKNEEEKMIDVLNKSQCAMGWNLFDLKGISMSYWIHKILMEDDFKLVTHPQCRLNPTMKEAARKEVVKMLETKMIYPILDNVWVSPVQVVPKKGGMTMIQN
ncbi:hypothetical protein KIW84_052329 [Lathyrus oleraceus]|uniref:Reverse transcriptase domain-containing protein n=1 Tax=Pisum sativum TaxID=3888 RepID=A0A9D4WQ01_PEA|nr:hypothetical protein KIW84_052329 [Pisum sativum]